jgi:DNA/RNA endonuclease G (NUC1)
MPLNSLGRRSSATVIAALLIIGGCTSAGNDKPLAPTQAASAPTLATAADPIPVGVVISQVYGGGGNSGATLKNDFIEIYNGTMADVSLAGWSVQYASSAGSSWQVTPLSGTLQSGHYYLVQESQGTGGTVALPTPDAPGTIAMSGTSGKVALVSSTAQLTGTCPTAVVDFVGFGSSANCFEGTGPTATLSNTTAAIRKDGGRTETDDNKLDFATGAPTPRNTASPVLPPLNVLSVSIDPSAPSAFVGSTVNFTASATLGGLPVAINSAAWTSSNTTVATIDPSSGVAAALTPGTSNIAVAVTTASGNRTVSTKLTVTGPAKTVTVSPTTWNLKSAQSKTFVASAVDENGSPVTTTFTWSSSDPSIAMVDATTGSVIGRAGGSATITATAPNGVFGTATVNVTAGNVSVSTRSDILPVGFQTQLFVNSGSADTQGAPVGNSNVLWSSSNPAIVSVDPANGIITANAAGSAVIKATAVSDGIASGSTTITTDVMPVGANARVGHNTELGIPTDADPSDDVIIARRQYTLSYNVAHGGPNWVSWNLDDSHKSHSGSSPRCNCFTADTALTRLGIQPWNTQDWINGGIWSRGHMSPSADWADTPGDNAPTFFLSNMIPQNQTANSGAWGGLENDLRAIATGSTEIYIIAGPIFTKNRSGAGVDGFGFMNSSGRIAVPDSMWKVAIVVPDTRSASEIDSPSDVQVIAVNMPNEASATGDWHNYSTTIDRIQRSTGYDLLSILPANVQCRVEVRNCVPVAHLTGDLAGGSEGETLSFDASTSSDADADALTYQWTLAGAPAGSTPTLTHTFADNGSYAVRVIVSDDKGAADTASATIVVANVAPRVAAFDGATILAGETYSATGSFSDPGADTWRGSVNYGDGSSTSALAIDGKSFSLEHQYTTAGSYTVAVNVLDKDGGMGSASAQVVVQSPLQGIANLRSMVAALGGRGGLNAGQINSLQVKLDNASRQLADGEENAASNMLEAFLNEIDALGKSGRVSDAAAAPLVDYARRVIVSIGG